MAKKRRASSSSSDAAAERRKAKSKPTKKEEEDKKKVAKKEKKDPPPKKRGNDSKSESDAEKRKRKKKPAAKESESDHGKKRSRSKRARSSSGSGSGARRKRPVKRSQKRSQSRRNKKDRRTGSKVARGSRSRSKSRKSDRRNRKGSRSPSKDRKKDRDKKKEDEGPQPGLGLQGDILQIFSEAAEEVKKSQDGIEGPAGGILGASGPLESSQASAVAGATTGESEPAPAPRRRKSGWDEGAPGGGFDAPPGSQPGLPPGAMPGGPQLPDPSKVMTIKQEWVGMLIGQKGETLRIVREASNGANIQIDQSTKEQGFSTLRIFGTPQQVSTAETLLLQKISEIDAKQNPQGPHEELMIEQSTVGYLLGKGGESLKSIKAQSNANVMVDQSTKEQGFTMVRIYGDIQAIEVAKGLVMQRITEANDRTSRHGGGLPGGLGKGMGGCMGGCMGGMMGDGMGAMCGGMDPGADVAAEYRVDQQHVGLLIGKSGATVKQIKAASGANVVIDQSMKHMGYSVCRIMKGAGEELAKQMIETKIREAQEADAQRGGPPNMSASDEVLVSQNFVGFLIGRGGEALRSIKEATGAVVVLDQTTKDQGFSVVRISGDPSVISHAKSIVENRVAQAEAVEAGRQPPESLMPMPGPGYGGPMGGPMGGPPMGKGAVPPPSSLGPNMGGSFDFGWPPAFGGGPPSSCYGSVPPPASLSPLGDGYMPGKGMSCPGGGPGMPYGTGPPGPMCGGCCKGGMPPMPPMPPLGGGPGPMGCGPPMGGMGGPPMGGMGGPPMMGQGPSGGFLQPPPLQPGALQQQLPPPGGLYDPF
mmetsp:Transcript_45966/g.106894  ORF Transcript_45966/g.106894 Transcript_45966/m.106894 type:complete len:815 (+) Transcript_45966:159-2603(+)